MRIARVRRVALTGPLGTVLLGLAVALPAALIRIDVLRRSGWLSIGTYDDGVYFSTAVALLHGRLPYRDLILLQPPGALLALSPFAAASDVVGDARAFALARIAFCLLGALDAALVAVLLRRFGAVAALTGGAVEAVFFPAVYVSRTLLLEPLGTTAVLLALLAARRAGPERRTWWAVAGLIAGAGVGVKIWNLVPALVLLLFARGGRIRFALGALVAVLAVYLPFFVLAPARMWTQVVLAQLGRPPSSNGALARWEVVLGVNVTGSTGSPVRGVSAADLAAVLGVALLGAALAVLVDGRARVLVALLAADLAVLLLTPSFFTQYAGLAAAPIALVVGAAVGVLLARVPDPVPRAVIALLVFGVVAGLSAGATRRIDAVRPPIAALRHELAAVPGCVVSDDPTVLVVTNRLSADLDQGCPFEADLSGTGYVLAIGRDVAGRYADPRFQRAAIAYLHSGSAYLRVRGGGLQLDEASLAVLERDPVLAGSGRWALRAPAGR